MVSKIHPCYSLLLVCMIFNFQIKAKNADIVIFSYNRPLQLYALLESIETYIKDIGQSYVIYRTSDDAYSTAYDEVKWKFNDVHFIQQGTNPYSDFKALTLKAAFESPNDYIIFAVDDIIVKDFIVISECIELLEKYNAYGFYLRMGKNLTECYAENCLQTLPPLRNLENAVYAWQFSQGNHDWCYPNTVDMTLYRKKDIEVFVRSCNYKSPTTFEGEWAAHWHKISHQIGLCFENSKIVNLPLNCVQQEWKNRNQNYLTPDQMLAIFNARNKIDIKPLFKIKNKAAHMAYEPIFIERT